jgi:hypothetical protein
LGSTEIKQELPSGSSETKRERSPDSMEAKQHNMRRRLGER